MDRIERAQRRLGQPARGHQDRAIDGQHGHRIQQLVGTIEQLVAGQLWIVSNGASDGAGNLAPHELARR